MIPRLRPTLVAFVLGGIAAAGQAPLGIWCLTLLGLAGLFYMICAQATRLRAALVGWLGGAGYFCASLSWIISPFLVDAPNDAWMAPFALLIMGFGLALFWGLAAALGRRSLGLVVALAAAELARGYVLTGFPWALIGHVWIDTPVAQLAAYVGPSGLTLLTCALAMGILGSTRVRIGAVFALALAWGFGAWQLAKPLPYMLEYDPELAQMIATSAGGATVAMGRQRVQGDLGWNSLSILSPTGVETHIYDKHHLVPFGEYIPFGDLAFEWFNISAFAAQTGNAYSAGDGPTVLDLGRLGQMLPLICYEAVFPQDLRTKTRATWILQITNDAWFGTLTGPFQHAAQARLRAIELGLPLVRVANTGVTAIYDARGRVRDRLDFGIGAYLDAKLPSPLPQTPYARWGEIPVLVLLIGLALVVALRTRARRA